VAQAVTYEIARQKEVKDKGGAIVNETRSWDATTRTTIPMRDKEVVQDYRFMPEPNLPPLHLNLSGDVTNEDFINVPAIERCLPMMPQQKRDKLASDHNLTQEMAIILVNEQILLEYFTKITQSNPKRSPKQVVNILINELLTVYNKNKVEVDDLRISSDQVGELVDMLEAQEINRNLARLILQEMIENPMSPRQIAAHKNWKQITDEAEVGELCEKVLSSPDGLKMVKAFKAGKSKVLMAIAGEINKQSGDRVNMAQVMEFLNKKLKT
jgi:aspartyl-tRNA(Asn)/glutamyl-tRNA(Gln) amidotransferase subunit B